MLGAQAAFDALREGRSRDALVAYAVKANPAPEVLALPVGTLREALVALDLPT